MPIDSLYPKSFASDNHAGTHPDVLAAMARANEGDAPAYGGDRWTREFEDHIKDVFGGAAAGFPVLNGAGANMVGLAGTVGRFDSIICPETAHIATHETGAAERLLGSKLVTVPTEDGKLVPDDIRTRLPVAGVDFEPLPRVVSISQVTELGTCYTPDEIAALADVAHANGMLLHVDGARLANAAAFLKCPLREFTTDAGVDVLSFGGTKNGALAAEAVIVLRPSLTAAIPFLRRQSLQLASKTRFISVQLSTLLTDDLWSRNATHANAMSHRLADGVTDLPGLTIRYPVESNAVFAALPKEAISILQEQFTFHVWDESENVVRWMTAFDTTPEHVDDFIAAIRKVLSP
ncbi:aminotransferase class V-fold PLP-dependent enzyme [Spongiactinospora sp. TRM90649]|uniref:threonine aldolase family protein n=1 Tax=Spongiactinospora sp. TRM90649 TaxID=3031114 RepID=UPI0023F76A40|nr:aminotransferase class V-fold PLP-dependent enzyme [Spongiactinospora sp. TRM90649]MDF5756160.1 aminotransferase class V-fold PLP-dependent enzyme [Spongiactinospora sp. TRM90649]